MPQILSNQLVSPMADTGDATRVPSVVSADAVPAIERQMDSFSNISRFRAVGNTAVPLFGSPVVG